MLCVEPCLLTASTGLERLGFYCGVRAALRAGPRATLHAGPLAALRAGLRAALRAGQRAAIRTGLRAALRAGPRAAQLSDQPQRHSAAGPALDKIRRKHAGSNKELLPCWTVLLLARYLCCHLYIFYNFLLYLFFTLSSCMFVICSLLNSLTNQVRRRETI
jgi:hypothetical protein